MIVFGYPIHKKYTIIILIILIGLLLTACKWDFDPRTSMLKYTFKSINKEKINGHNEHK